MPRKKPDATVPVGKKIKQARTKKKIALNNLANDTGFKVTVLGYTDSLGDREYNLLLSQFRANIVRSYLVGKGIAPSRIKAIALADDNPRETNDTSAGRAANRRVEIEVKRK